jgi:hypothetical protein
MQRYLVSAAGFGMLASVILPLSSALAQDAKPLGGQNGWTAWTLGEKSGKVCYLVGHPSKSEPANASRGRVDMLITHRPADKSLNVVNLDLGYGAKEGAKAELEIDGKKFTLFIDKESAWANDAAGDALITGTLFKGKRAVVRATSARGTATTDIYALEGLAPTLALIDKACNVKR